MQQNIGAALNNMSLNFLQNVNISLYTTMRVGGNARHMVVVKSLDELKEALSFADQKNLNFFVLGEGSNTIFTDSGFKGLIILNKIKINSEFKLQDDVITVGSGSNWDDLVKFSVSNNLTGIETLSLIPGTVGAAPVQNIGAYGQQIADSILEVGALDTKTNRLVKFKAKDCNFNYRRSRFNGEDKGRFIITKLKLKLKTGNYQGELYKDVESYFQKLNLVKNEYSPLEIRQAIISIRQKKMPDPAKVANTGSFFKNPIITIEKFEELKLKAPGILLPPIGWAQPPYWQINEGYKISAGWLVQESGFANHYDNRLNFGTWPKQNLVVYSKLNQPEYNNLQKFKNNIIQAVNYKFGIILQQEPEEVVL